MTKRPQFNPDRARGASLFDAFDNPPTPPPTDKSHATNQGAQQPITVSAISELIANALVDQLPFSVRVVGQISNLSKRNHWFFSLKDDDAVLQCVAWASKARSFSVEAADGQSVLATGTIRHYAPQGRTQLYVEALEPIGLGELERRFRELCGELRQAGYFDPRRKRSLPTCPRRIAIITSAAGAALQDVVSTLARRSPMVELLVLDVRVQGESAVKEIVQALALVKRKHESLGIDTLLLTRGGGSLEDLWAFNERAVCDAVYECPIPTVAAIGHETDTTIAELVADQRCATPTQAAVQIAPDAADLLSQLDHFERRIQTQIGHGLRLAKQQLRALEARLPRPDVVLESASNRLRERARALNSAITAGLTKSHLRVHTFASKLEKHRPERVIIGRENTLEMATFRLFSSVLADFASKRRDLETAADGLVRAVNSRLDRSNSRLEDLGRTLAGLDPRSVLGRGYSITSRADGSIMTRRKSIRPGETMHTQLVDGVITSTVNEIHAVEENKFSELFDPLE